MYDEKKVARVNELVREIKDKEDELNALFGGEQPRQKRTWTRRTANGETPPGETGETIPPAQ